MGESLKKAYQLKRVSSRVFKQADIYLSKVYGTYFGQKWPLIRSALQEPENLIPLSSLPSVDHRSVGRKKALEPKLGGNVFGELSQLKTKLEQDHALHKRAIPSVSKQRSQRQWELVKLDDETTRHGQFYDENIFFDIEAYTSLKSQKNMEAPENEWPLLHFSDTLESSCEQKIVSTVEEWLKKPRTSSKDSDAFQVSITDVLATCLLDLKAGDNVLDLNSADARFVALARVLNPQLSFGSLVSDSSYSSHNQRRNGIRSILSLDDENHCHDEQKRPMLFKDFDTFDYESGLFRQAFDKIVVSVPYLNDRSALVDFSSNNSFHNRNVIRLNQLSTLQKSFLSMALLAAKPNASVVYCLRSLCPSHGDTIVKECCQTFNISQERAQENLRCNLVQLTRMLDPMKKLVNVHCGDFGIFIYPTYERNFGPAYLSLLKVKP